MGEEWALSLVLYGAHPASSYPVDNMGYFPGGKAAGA